jgi:hypothetical protein
MTFPHSAHEWFVLAERGALRLVMTMTGFTLMIIGLALGVTMVMLPAGLFLGLTGFGVLLWGALGDLPIDN